MATVTEPRPLADLEQDAVARLEAEHIAALQAANHRTPEETS